REGTITQRAIEPAHAGVERRVDRVTELHADRRVADRQEPQSARAWTSTPARSRPSRIARAFATASGLSPWRHSVSAWRLTSAPSVLPRRPGCRARRGA